MTSTSTAPFIFKANESSADTIAPTLSDACKAGDLELTKQIVGESTPTDVPPLLLHTAVNSGNVSLVRYLLSSKIVTDVDVKDASGFTPLYTACKDGHVGMARCLVDEFGANPSHLGFGWQNNFFDPNVVQFLVVDCGLNATSQFIQQFGSAETARHEFMKELKNIIRSVDTKYFDQITAQKAGFHIQLPLITQRFHLNATFENHPPLDLKVYVASVPDDATTEYKLAIPASHEPLVTVNKAKLAKSCEFMTTLLIGELNDVQRDSNGEEFVILRTELIGNPKQEWLRMLLIALGCTVDDKQGVVEYSVNKKAFITYDQVIDVLKYACACVPLMLPLPEKWLLEVAQIAQECNENWKCDVMGYKNGLRLRISAPLLTEEDMLIWWNAFDKHIEEKTKEAQDVLFFLLTHAHPDHRVVSQKSFDELEKMGEHKFSKFLVKQPDNFRFADRIFRVSKFDIFAPHEVYVRAEQ